MAKTKISEFSSTPGNNTDIDGINIAEGCAPSGINNAIRELMSQLKDFQAGTAGDSFNGPVGTSTAAAGAFTTLSASSTVSGTGFSNYLASPPAIGGTTAAAGSFTTLTTSGAVTHNAGTANGVAYLNGSKVLTTGSALTFDGTTLTGTASGGLAANFNRTASSGPTVKVQVVGNDVGTLGSDTGGNGIFDIVAATSLHLRTGTDGTFPRYIGFSANGSEQMRLTSTGLGIGTSSPTYKVEAIGSSPAFFGESSTNGTQVGYRATMPSNSTNCFVGWVSDAVAGLNGDLALCPRTSAGGRILFFTGSTTPSERMRLDSSGNLGLGVTPSAWAGKALQVTTFAGFGASADGDLIAGNNCYNSASGVYRYTASSLGSSLYMQTFGNHKWYIAPSGTAGNAISFTQAMTLDASGRLGIGTTSPQASLTVGSVAAGTGESTNRGLIQIQSNGGGSATGGGGLEFKSASSGGGYGWMVASPDLGAGSVPLVFSHRNESASWTERARIDSSGNLLVGTTSASFGQSGFLMLPSYSAAGNSGMAIQHVNGSASGSNYLAFIFNAGQIGNIAQSGTTSVAYNTTSDYRLKDNTAPMTGALAKVAALKPCTYKWKADGSDGEGFIAHELAEVCPQAVTGEKDAVDAEGKPVYQGVDTSFLVATLTAAIQELKAEFDAYKATHP